MIDLQNLTFDYQKTALFHNLTLFIPKGNIYGLLGVNGAGKTTLLKLISGQLYAQEGSLQVLGYNPANRDPAMLRDIYYLPEEFYLPSISPEEYLKIQSPFYPKFSFTDFTRFADHFGLNLSKKLSELSFGQKKKFLLSFGLASNTSLLIMDEPTNGLDIPSKTQFRRTVASAITDQRSFIISTHQVRDMENLIDPIIILHDGRIVFHESLQRVAEKVAIKLMKTMPQEGTYLYAEPVPGGFSVVLPRGDEDEETSIELEALFNAVVTVPRRMEKLLGENSKTEGRNQ